MGKTLFILNIPEPELRKAAPPPVKRHKNKKLYSRKCKHKGSMAPGSGGFFMPKF